ncbi:hypothetical protein KEM55_002371 [Ascosphaera atra]|nr:hypothetical protein KEM55_002371 [Ascosphaera atra]
MAYLRSIVSLLLPLSLLFSPSTALITSRPICGITGIPRSSVSATQTRIVSTFEECVLFCQSLDVDIANGCKSFSYFEFNTGNPDEDRNGLCSLYAGTVEETVRATSRSDVLYWDVECFDEMGRMDGGDGNDKKDEKNATPSSFAYLPVGTDHPVVTPTPVPIIPSAPPVLPTSFTFTIPTPPLPLPPTLGTGTTKTIVIPTVHGTGLVSILPVHDPEPEPTMTMTMVVTTTAAMSSTGGEESATATT